MSTLRFVVPQSPVTLAELAEEAEAVVAVVELALLLLAAPMQQVEWAEPVEMRAASSERLPDRAESGLQAHQPRIIFKA